MIAGSTMRARWTAMSIICLFNVLNYLDRMLLAGSVPLVKKEFQLSDTQVGLMSAAFAVVFAICGIAFGRVADRYPRRLIIVFTVGLWSAMTAAFGLSGTFAALLITRAAIAVGEAGYTPAAYSMISDLFKPARRSMAFGLFLAASSVGTIGGLALGGWMSESFGWRASFLIFGAPGILLALVTYFFLKEPERGGLDPVDAVRIEQPNMIEAMKALARNRLFVWLCLLTGFGGFLTVGIAQWLPSFLARSYDVSLSKVGLICAIALGAGLGIGQVTGGWVSTRMSKHGIFEPLRICAYANFALVPLLGAAFWSPRIEMCALLVMTAAIVGGMAHAPKFAAMQNGVDVRLRGVALGMTMLLGAICGMAIGPVLVGMISDRLQTVMNEADALRLALTSSLALFLIASACAWQAYRVASGRAAGFADDAKHRPI